MTRRELTATGCVLVLCALTVTTACATEPAASTPPATTETVAEFGDSRITAEELDELAAGQLLRLRQQMYQTRRQVLESEIYQRLLEEAAAAEGLTAAEYEQRELEAAVTPPSEQQIEQVMNQYRSRLAKEDDKAREQVVNYLAQQAQQAAQADLRQRLFEAAEVRISLEPPRMDPKIQAHNPARGPADAPVTLIEYTDYQCPYCDRVQETIDRVMEVYEGQVRHVFKNLPLPMHAQAELAAQAGLCAADQGQFWQLHDWMFANKNNLSRDSIVTAAGELGLSSDELAACLDNQTHAPHVQQDMEEARGFGITGTPGFLVNGRLVTGAQPFEAFAQIIDEELRKAGIEPPAPAETGAEASSDQSGATS